MHVGHKNTCCPHFALTSEQSQAKAPYSVSSSSVKLAQVITEPLAPSQQAYIYTLRSSTSKHACTVYNIISRSCMQDASHIRYDMRGQDGCWPAGCACCGAARALKLIT